MASLRICRRLSVLSHTGATWRKSTLRARSCGAFIYADNVCPNAHTGYTLGDIRIRSGKVADCPEVIEGVSTVRRLCSPGSNCRVRYSSSVVPDRLLFAHTDSVPV